MPDNEEYFIDSASTVDTLPVSRVRDWAGRVLVGLERADITKLTATGWTPPERFCVKAADGGDGHLRGAVPAGGGRPRPALPGGGQRLPRPAGRPGRPVLRPRRDGPRRGTHRGAGLRGGGGGWARHPRAEQVLPRRLLRPLGRRGLPGRPCRGAAAAGPDLAVDGPGPGGRVRPLRRRVRHSAGDAGLPRRVHGRSRPRRPARRPLLQPGLRGGLRRRRQPEAWARAFNVDIADRLA